MPLTEPQGTPLLYTPIPPGDASAHLQHRLGTRLDDLVDLLTSSNFYIELTLILLAIGLASLLTIYLQEKIKRQLALYPPKSIDVEFITKPLRLLGVGLVLPFLGGTQALVTALEIGGNFTHGIIQLCYAYLLTKCVTMAIRQKPVAYFVSTAIIINAALHAARVSRAVSAYLDSLALDAGQYHITALHMVHGFVIFVVVFWGAGILSGALESYLRRSTRLSTNTRHLTVKFFKIFLYVVAVLITLSAVGIDLTVFAIFSGALGVGIGLGLQKMTANFVSGVTMLMERSIKIGDLIEVGTYTGWVRQLNIRYVLLETSDGRELIIPNEELVSTRVINWTLSHTMASIEVKATVTFDSDPVRARELMLAAALEHPRCMKDPPPTCWLREFAGNGISFTLTFWIPDVKQGRKEPQSDVMFSMLKKFNQNGITLARGA